MSDDLILLAACILLFVIPMLVCCLQKDEEQRSYKKMKWVRKWQVGKFVVSINEFGYWGCSCPDWIYQRCKLKEKRDCFHIFTIKQSKLPIVPDVVKEANEEIIGGCIRRQIHTESKTRRKELPVATRHIKGEPDFLHEE